MGCSSSKPALLPPDVDVEVIRGQQARERVKLNFKAGSIKDTARGLKGGKKAATWVMNGSEKRYLIYSYLIDMSKTGYRRQYIASADGLTTFCYFERTFNPYIKSHCYQCRAYDDSRTLFTVYRQGKDDLIVEINASYDPRDSSWNGRYGMDPGPVLRLNFHGGILKLDDPNSGMEFNCAEIHAQAIVVQRGIDQVLTAVLCAIVTEIKELNGLLKLATYATPGPAKGGTGVAMRGATHFMQADQNARPMARNPEQMALYAAGDIAYGMSKGQSLPDSAYASANNSIHQMSRDPSRDSSRTRSPNRREESRGRSQSSRRQPPNSRSNSRRPNEYHGYDY